MVKAVYIHIPFCSDICTYCDFCKYYYNESFVNKYLVSLEKEIRSIYKGEVIETLYIGGGTPSCLNLKQLEKLLKITKIFKTNNLEFTFEANIESIDEAKVKLIKNYGVNRISLGVQTFNERFLTFLNRHHTKEMVTEKIAMIKKYIDNINVDLIYAILGETLEELNNDLDIILDLKVKHISTYSLMIEKNTILYNHKIKNIDEDLDFKMYELIMKRLKDFEHYEISNFGQYKCRHNLTYWNNEEYYGFGLGASGYIGNVRYTNTKSLNHYLNDNYCYDRESLSFNEKVENAFILGLRKIKGINKDSFYRKYKINILDISEVLNLINDGKLINDKENVYINPKYLYVNNDILIDFMGVDYEKYV